MKLLLLDVLKIDNPFWIDLLLNNKWCLGLPENFSGMQVEVLH